MNVRDWIDARSACALLGVRPQTLYAYVSRGLVRARSDSGDARRSLYARLDLEALVRQHRRPRARAEVAEAAIRWGDPVLATAISDVRDGQLWFGARRAEECADGMTLEQVAAHHCGVADFLTAESSLPPAGPGPIARVLHLLASQAATAVPMSGSQRLAIASQGAALLPAVTDALLGCRGSGPVHIRFCKAWGLNDTATEAVRRALVLLSDHELNPSSFAVRVCASTGSSLPAALLAGMATLTGPRHGGVAQMAELALQAAIAGPVGIERFLQENRSQSPYGYGYGHPLYPAGDPRARDLIAVLPADSPAVAGVEALAERLDIPPNIDAALAALVLVHRLPAAAGFVLFGAGRMTGWIAHAIEQVLGGEIIRPRARYAGPLPR